MEITAKGENDIPYDGGLGTGGKVRKQPHGRYHKKPYDQPAARVSGSLDRNNGGWISTLMDPVQRIITYMAHSPSALISRKLVTPVESNLHPLEQRLHLQGTDVNPDTELRDTEATITAPIDQINMRNENGSTTSQIGSIDSTTKDQEQSTKLISRFPTSHENNLVSSPPLGSQKSFHECIASPAELAKDYMRSKSSQVSRGLHGRVAKEDSVFLNKSSCPPKLSTISLLPRSSIRNCLPENCFVTPKYRRRNSANTMATTPYSRPRESALKMPSSHSTLEESLPSGSRQGAHKDLKRMCSILDSDVGSLVSVRRTRQKSNLSSRSLPLPSDSPLSVRGSGVGLDSRHASSYKFPHTSIRSGEDKPANTSTRSTEDKPGSNFKLVPSKSAEIASKISQLLEKMVTTKEKPPSKLSSSSKLHCPDPNSLPNVKAPKLLDNLQQTTSPDSSYQKSRGKPIENGSREVLAPHEKPATVNFGKN